VAPATHHSIATKHVRAIGLFAPASFMQFSDLSAIEEETHVLPAEQMVESLFADHELVVRRMQIHGKNA
jgi:starvation-inducible DNA-binding protein